MAAIYSMTAFARETAETEQGALTVEIRTVNHRYLDCSFKLPDALRNLEIRLRQQAAAKLARGKLECLFRLQPQAAQAPALAINHEQMMRVIVAATTVATALSQAQPINPLEVLQFPGVCSVAEADEEALQASAAALFDAALESLVENRAREGAKLAAMIQDRLGQVEVETAATRELLPELKQQQRARLLARLAELEVEVDSDRLEQELVYLAQKADVDEELDRLHTHVEEVRRTLDQGGPCGRRLDFLMQELNREANTLSSKSIASSNTHSAVQLKVLIEQMREQIQNIE
ncbi:YicC/YloC family endoribonuclease [Haliea sp. E1-2-M8]|uniref:YicC/YloC family endoribonuclease n=1 Tax=Haliea sp. E1-2-M8 TaxID=3064706 RepID=UPI0027241E2C|nr:YicC/YloC family endoribonuclease [Haliea sp. E1-2-M8]MDO8860167.1 YicC/YloC family endoribonuclease [Haliea sp. E1-2-M8]